MFEQYKEDIKKILELSDCVIGRHAHLVGDRIVLNIDEYITEIPEWLFE